MRKYVAEFIGTAVLVFFGCGSAVAANALFTAMGMGLPVAFTTLLIAFAFGLSIVAMSYSIGNISGCHVNPAVSLGMLISKKMSGKDFIGYVIAQIIGAIAGSAILGVCIGGYTSLGANGYGDSSTFGITMWVALLIEVILSFVFVITVIGVTDKVQNGSIAGLVIGLTLTLVHIFGVPFTGTSVNPARSIGPAVMQLIGGDSTAIGQLWVFIVAPLVGAALAALIYMFLNSEPKETAALDEILVEATEAEEAEEVEEIPEIEPSTR